MNPRQILWFFRVVIACLAAVWPPAALWAVEDFTLLHLSDVHFPFAAEETRETLSKLPVTAPIQLNAYQVTVPKPSFAIVTGDVNEYGGGAGAWEGYLGLWKDIPFPVYHELGNHDNTWNCGRPRLRQLTGSPFYAFEKYGVKFIGWDSATPQDPRPSIAQEGLVWLDAELKRSPVDQPLFVFLHHPLDGKEFASDYDTARLLEMLHTRNVALMLVGHTHNHRVFNVDGLDSVSGGSTFGKTPGFSVVAVRDDVLYVSHQLLAPNPKRLPLLSKPLPQHAPSLQIESVSPADGTVFEDGRPLEWTLRLAGQAAITSTTLALDGKRLPGIRPEGGSWKASVSREGLVPGAHTVRFAFADAHENTAHKTVCFWVNGGGLRVAWMRQLPGSIQSTPIVDNGILYVGANSGSLNAIDAATGEIRRREGGGDGEVRSRPLVYKVSGGDSTIVSFGSSDGFLRAVNAEGLLWKRDLGSAIYSSPILSEGRVICATNRGEIVAVDPASGSVLWRCKKPQYAVESPVCAGGGAVFAGAWDGYVYAINEADGKMQWRKPSHGSIQKKTLNRYYSPADCGPVFLAGQLLIADRADYLTVMNAQTGEETLAEPHCVAVAPSADGQFVYVRHTDNRISKRRSDGSVVWTAAVPTGVAPAPSVEAQGRVWTVSNTGTLSAVNSDTGALEAQWRALPGLYVFASPAADEERVYVADMGGHLVALQME
ncbi:MAG: PQQ-binding-like beta-propeller repeat protein [Candidatus Sumerlaeota bacterium]|nr:PQQ-binding-like beta-propeller repeat protein [Candidatus Sumerlaeota bacterium]